MEIDLTKAFDMVNHTKLIRALSLSSLSNNTKRWRSSKGEQLVDDTTLPSLDRSIPRRESLRVHVCPLRYSTSLSLAESLSAHSPIIEEWAGELALAISAPKSMITLFTPQFAQSNIHP